MEIGYRFLTIADIKQYTFNEDVDSECILQSGLDLYKESIINYPHKHDDDDYAMCIAVASGKIVGRFVLFPTVLKVGGDSLPILTGGGILVSEKYRGYGIGTNLIKSVLEKDVYLGALYTRAAYNIVRKTEIMLEIPQYVKYRYHGLKKILDLPIYLRQALLSRHYVVKELTVVPEWAETMATSDDHKYMEVHNTAWLQWSLDNDATGIKEDYQSFYAIYDKKEVPVGFFMTKVRHLEQEGNPFVKANLIEWASSDHSKLDEADINILSLATYPPEVSRFWTISENPRTASKLKRHAYKRKGWFAMSITKDDRFNDIGNVSQWRIRYGCCNTALVE